MPETLTRFSKDKKHLDRVKNRLKPDAFWNRKSPHEISVVDIDKKRGDDSAIFMIGDLIYASTDKLSIARGDMQRIDIESIPCDPASGTLFLEHCPVDSILEHYNIKINCDLSELVVKTNLASRLSHISSLVIRQV